MTTTNQGLSFAEIEQIVAQRVANAIKTIAIYETKIRMARESMSRTKQQKVKVADNASNKRKWEGDHNGSSSQQQNTEHKVFGAHTVGLSNKKDYAGSLPLCNKCTFHHNGPCTVKCANCKRVGHLTRDYRNPTTSNNQKTLTCYKCGKQGHYRNNCPGLKNRNHRNQAGGTKACGMVYALGGETN
ncbi:reverse transcriptase domain-containing protein [Tanacetum coccineum]|uniref:Reverse transcriptase domain-containing protein n=1 Tax=Tanacetum coccineum TaxID=301880 RepID=A0ABQ5GDK2_9ASTR